jgi:hypothetical protein
MTTAQRIAEQGRKEGQAPGLIKLLTHRFKEPVPAPALARIQGASVAELDCWTERALEAESLDDVLR